mgnify:FL=1
MTNHHKNHSKTPFHRLVNAFRFSIDGYAATFKHEAAFRQEVVLAAILIPVALLVDVSAIAKALMIGSIFLTLIVELMNSAIEAIVDRVSLELHPLSKRAKDIGSGAVLLSLVNVVVIWGLVLAERYM